MSGDTINMAVQSYYNSNSVNTNNSSFTDVLNSLANALFTTTGGSHGNVSNFTSSGSTVYTGLNSFLGSNDPVKTGYPKAYLNWIFLDDQFNYVSSLSGAIAVASSTYAAGTLNTVAPGSALTLNRSGYLYIWVSNETQNWDVFFDNLSVQHKQGPMLEENHYYPFGLAMAGISDKALEPNYTENKYRYNGGSELQNKEFSDGSGLELYDANARMYDPQIGRFGGIDVLSGTTMSISSYSFGFDDPILSNDPTGMEATTKTAPPDYLYNVQQLLGYVQQYGLTGFDDGFYNLQIEQGGGFSPQSYYDANFTATKGQNSEGVDGV